MGCWQWGVGGVGEGGLNAMFKIFLKMLIIAQGVSIALSNLRNAFCQQI